MSKIKIITDTCADLDKSLLDTYGVDIARMTVCVNGERFYVSPEHGGVPIKELYEAMRAGERVVAEPVSATEFEQVFTKYAEDGFDIVYVACSSALSESLETGKLVARRVMEKRVGSKIVCVDSGSACGGEALVVIEAAEFAKTAQSIVDVAEHIEGMKTRVVDIGTVSDFDYLKNIGAIKSSEAFFGKLFGKFPIIANGAVVKKIGGRENALDACVQTLKARLIDEFPASEQTIFIEHGDDGEAADRLADKVKELIAPKSVHVCYLGPTLGVSSGSNAVALFGFGDPALAAVKK